MKKRMILKIAAAACVVALLVCAALIFGNTFKLGVSYADADQYTAGGSALNGPVENLDIHWTEGSVVIAYHAGNTVEIAETAPKAISADAQLRWWLDGTTLHIQYAKSGYFTLRSLDKQLTVTLPEGIELQDVAIDTTSADVQTAALRAKTLTVESTSGDMDLAQADAAERVELSSTSGDVRASLGGVDVLRIDSTSGKVSVEAGAAKDVAVDTTSGDIALRLAAFDRLAIESTSGDVTAALPSKPGFRGEIRTTSGGVDSGLALKREGGSYACGDGSASLSIHTTSGDVRLEESNAE